VPQGDKGELLLIGPQVTTHYWNDEEKSAKSFVKIQYKGEERNAYRTGDLCYLNERGNIMYCGRIDHQVQVNGYRVELGEIEFHSKKFLGNEKNLVAFPIKNTMGSTAVYMAIEGFDKTQEQALVSYLRKNLPVYMIPEKIIAIDALPLTISGKTDRGKLSTVYQPNN
jgi:D-alanine--poly(phosphoribitol) ligase subunit 1